MIQYFQGLKRQMQLVILLILILARVHVFKNYVIVL